MESSMTKMQKRLAQFELQLGREVPEEVKEKSPEEGEQHISSWKKSKTALVFGLKVRIYNGMARKPVIEG